MLTIVGIILILLIMAFGWHEHRKGHFAQLKRELKGQPVAAPPPIQPGGQDFIKLQRTPIPGGSSPEFMSATLLPGCGMNFLQITALLPDKGEVNLLESPSLEEAAQIFGDQGAKPQDARPTVGGPIEVPWAGRTWGYTSADNMVNVMWHGNRLTLPNTAGQSDKGVAGSAEGGLFWSQASESVKTNVMPDGGALQAVFHSGSFDGHWISKTDVTTRVQMSGRAIEMTVTAQNVGTAAEPIGIGWRPKFRILNANRARETLQIPNSVRVDVPNRVTGMPSGKLLPVQGTPYDFSKEGGTPLGNLDLDDTYVHLRPALLDNGPSVELRDPESNYGLRISAISSTIKAIRVYAPAGAQFISIDPQFNYDDPFGREWPKTEDTGMVVLEPGDSAQWKIRLEIFSLQMPDPGHL
jgi:galactose mutarotase-like enzyme